MSLSFIDDGRLTGKDIYAKQIIDFLFFAGKVDK
jgi:hypothetical protein